ncbi:MAG: hypothetical protein AAB414_04470 [Patescibacteria group bacterium]
MKEEGLTLLEVMIAMGIAMIVGTLLVAIIVNSAGIFYQESSRLSLGVNINDALSKVRGDIKRASSVASSYTSGSTTYTSGLTQLVLKILSQDSQGNIIADTFDFFVYFLDQNKLRLKTFPDPLSSRKAQDQIFSTNAEVLSFKYLDSTNPPNDVTPILATRVKITLTLKQKSGAGYETNTATSEASLRND